MSCVQGVYRAFLANSKFVSAASAPHIAFMSTCCVELWGLDLQFSYQHAFGAIRQLALALRAALSMKTQDAYKDVSACLLSVLLHSILRGGVQWHECLLCVLSVCQGGFALRVVENASLRVACMDVPACYLC